MSTAVVLARWLIALEVIGWGLYPYLYLATPGLRDRGLTVAKPFALLLFAYPAWLLASLGPPLFVTPVLLGAFVVLAAVGWVLASRSLPAFLRASWPYVLAAELLFVAAFLGYAWLRSYTPEILGTEKPMEIGFLSAATRGATMPPPDPWLSGYTINYYYLGYVIVAAVAKVTGVVSSVAFNLGLATLFAATLTGGTGVTANLLARTGEKQHPLPRLRTLGTGLLGGYLLALAGNMYAARDILEHGRQAIDAWWWGGLGWNASRVVIDSGFPARFFGPNVPPSPTINEFPSFSFILGDLHAHVLALPFTLLALALALDAWFAPPLARTPPPRPPILGGATQGDAGGTAHSSMPGVAIEGGAEKPSRPPILGVAARLQRLGSPQHWGAGGGVARLLLAAFAIGSLYALNSWDLPTYAVIYLFALALPEFFRGRVGARRWVAGGLFVALAVLLFVPYYLHFTSLIGGQPFDLPEPWRSLPLVSRLSRTLGIVIWGKTPPDQFFTVYLLPYVVGLLFLVWLWRRVGGGPAPSGVLG
ncbi:MAG TPA: DUF2298 domain-containing protein, partial [Thermomicrobiales bacterium]|nr:DUF2298 domain-containing protein [Thermomicrobiales bacterium]